jgi:AraC-like DNA-binding protein
MEICFLVKGRQTYSVGGKIYSLRGGDVFVTFPDEVHSTGGLPQEKGVLYWMVLAVPKQGETFLGLPKSDGAALLRTLRRIPLRHFRGSWKMKEHLDSFTRLFHEPSNSLRACALANHAVAFLLEVVGCAQNPARRSSVRPLLPVLDHIQNHLGEPLGVPELARRSGLSAARFKVRFKAETGVPPGEYVQRARIEEARRRLAAKDATITRIAFDLGFSSSQYFATVFKRFTGKSPRDSTC